MLMSQSSLVLTMIHHRLDNASACCLGSGSGAGSISEGGLEYGSSSVSVLPIFCRPGRSNNTSNREFDLLMMGQQSSIRSSGNKFEQLCVYPFQYSLKSYTLRAEGLHPHPQQQH